MLTCALFAAARVHFTTERTESTESAARADGLSGSALEILDVREIATDRALVRNQVFAAEHGDDSAFHFSVDAAFHASSNSTPVIDVSRSIRFGARRPTPMAQDASAFRPEQRCAMRAGGAA